MHNRIREFRVRLDLTQDELARKVGVRRETIVFLEKNKYNPSLRLAYDIARTFDCRIEDVFLFDLSEDQRLYDSDNHAERSS